MNCHCVQTLLSPFIDRELNAEESRELRRHLFTCPECELEYKELLQVKSLLENITPEEYEFDPLASLHARLQEEDCCLLPSSSGKLIWIQRLGLIAACIVIYLVTSSLLFPSDQTGTSGLADRRSNFMATPAAWDQSFSIDQSVPVYQASLVLP